ncbi:MAG: hypothetical protein Q9P01_22335 [Anaerolineae bacterium]|nr:hypothetical protein [Anaerolineae bacterium]MDQ7037476.1 hypothetical protein [Anaerolineae bacterium]
MKKPSAVLHMTGYGLVYGFLLAMLYTWSFVIVLGGTGGADWEAIVFTLPFGLLFGALPGAVMGFIEGWILRYKTRDIQIPLNQTDWSNTRKSARKTIGGLTFLLMFGLLSLLFGGWTNFLLTTIPAAIAGGAAAYAVNRYMKKLRVWGNIGKMKNDYKTKNQLADTDSTNNAAHLTTETDSQIQSQR